MISSKPWLWRGAFPCHKSMVVWKSSHDHLDFAKLPCRVVYLLKHRPGQYGKTREGHVSKQARCPFSSTSSQSSIVRAVKRRHAWHGRYVRTLHMSSTAKEQPFCKELRREQRILCCHMLLGGRIPGAPQPYARLLRRQRLPVRCHRAYGNTRGSFVLLQCLRQIDLSLLYKQKPIPERRRLA